MEAGPRQGWYGDPEDPGRLRWWDGTRWTEHTQARPVDAGTAASSTTPQHDADAAREAQELLAMPLPTAASEQPDPTQRVLPWLIGGAIILLALGVTAVVLSSESEDNALPVNTQAPLDPDAEAADSEAQALVRTAQTAIETYATDNAGSYEGATPGGLIALEPGLGSATLSVEPATDSYSVSVESTSGNTFTITRDSAGTIALTCGDAGVGGCPANGFWG